ncbi:glycosyltransferase [Paenibacillaceae bacterium]|nr:glycosyltransferase [Paenibacillaceae bacterium]
MISIIIPTYRRVADLSRCLDGLQNQLHKPDEVIVIVRRTDAETNEFLRNHSFASIGLRKIDVDQPGQVAALNQGIAASRGDIIAITDDDTIPRPNWLQCIQTHMDRDPLLGGVGGRDWLHEENGIVDGAKKVVGKIRWFGKIVGNHHLGVGPPREVDILKGANMSYRRVAIEGLAFNNELKGDGAQVCNDMAFSLAVKARGWKLIYDPDVAVDHYPAIRHDDDRRNEFNKRALYNMVHNETFSLRSYCKPVHLALHICWTLAVGSSAAPGLLHWLRLLIRKDIHATDKWLTAVTGRRDGLRRKAGSVQGNDHTCRRQA